MEAYTVPGSVDIIEKMKEAIKLLNQSKDDEKVIVASFKVMEALKERITCFQKMPYFETNEDPRIPSRFVEFEPTYMLDQLIQVYHSWFLKPGQYTIITRKEYEQFKKEGKL